MNHRPIYVVLGVIVLLIGASGVAVATPGAGPSSDLPDPVPDFVSSMLGSIGDFVTGVLHAVFGLIEALTPEAAGDGIDTDTENVHG